MDERARYRRTRIVLERREGVPWSVIASRHGVSMARAKQIHADGLRDGRRQLRVARYLLRILPFVPPGV